MSYPPAGHRQVQAATDTYKNNSRQPSAKIIDAEYVEIAPPPRIEVYNQERQDLDNLLAGEATSKPAPQTNSPLTTAAAKYQQSASNASEQASKHFDTYA